MARKKQKLKENKNKLKNLLKANKIRECQVNLIRLTIKSMYKSMVR